MLWVKGDSAALIAAEMGETISKTRRAEAILTFDNQLAFDIFNIPLCRFPDFSRELKHFAPLLPWDPLH